MTDEIDPKDRLLVVNEAFYAAFASGDLAWMTDIWSARREIACIHPGHDTRVGRTEVLSSWFDILQQPPGVQFTDARPMMHGEVGFVFCRERIGPHTLAATNTFVWESGRWRMVHHQASPVHAPPPDVAEPSPDGTVH
ncbi:MAG: nuclear transport factor 2 family protein [Minwuia sp.]|nr:nuclear transport factor 2 family protein [Minwuia sp.]